MPARSSVWPRTPCASSPARIAPAAGWGFCLVVLVACMGQSCGSTPVVPSGDSDEQVLGYQPKNPTGQPPADDAPYDESEFPSESPADLTQPRTLTITASVWTGKPPLSVSFFASTIEGGLTPTGLIWDFGDGTTAEGLRVKHTFQSEGAYKVTLCPGPNTPSAADITCGQGFINVTTNPATTPDTTTPGSGSSKTLKITASRWTGTAPFLIAFTASTVEGGLAPAGLLWDFGDGSTAVGSRIEHTFQTAGSYTVRLCPGPTTPSPELITCGQGTVVILGEGVQTPPTDPVCTLEITVQPAPLAVDSGATAGFSVAAAASGTVSYQWYKAGQPLSNGGAVTGATAPTLTIAATQTGDAAAYRVSVSNECGAVFSDEATLTVHPPNWASRPIRIVVPYQTAADTTYTFTAASRYLTDNNPDASTGAFRNYTWRAGDTFMVTQVQTWSGTDMNPALLRPYRIKRKVNSRTLEFETPLRSRHPGLVESSGDAYHIRGKLHREWTADLLLTYLKESLANKSDIDVGTSCVGSGINIHVGEPQCGQTGVDLTSPPVDAEGYVLKGISDTHYLIAGVNEEGIQNGAYEFLERYVGVRWTLPDSHFTAQEWSRLPPAWQPRNAQNQPMYSVRGDHVPVHSPGLSIPVEEVRENPAYLTRYGTGYGYSSNSAGSVHVKWMRRMRASLSVQSGHNINSLYPPSLYAASNPEFYPCQSGNCGASAAGRYIPGDDKSVIWMPNFSAGELAAAGAARLRAYFSENPEATSFSISLQDEKGYMDMSPASFAREPAAEGCSVNQTSDGCPTRIALNSGGLRDMSWSFFTFANDLIAQIRAGTSAYDDRYLGALVYHQTFDPPEYLTRSGGVPFGPEKKLDAHIIPFIAFEHLRLVDDRPEVGQRAWYQNVVARWKAIAAGDLGVHDYIYSDLCPILPLSLFAETLAADRAAGIRHNSSEHYPNWAEAFKFYAYFKLLWNPQLKMLDDADGPGMLSDWCRAAVGPAAAPHLLEFYLGWDNFWSGRNADGGAKHMRYLLNSNRSFATYRTPDPLDDLTVAVLMKQSPILLDNCLAAALADGSASVDQRNRARLLRAQYEYWNLTGKAHRPTADAQAAPLPAELDATVAGVTESLTAQGARIAWEQTWPTDNDNGNHHIMSPALGGLAGETWHTPGFFRLIPYASHSVGGQTVYDILSAIDPARYPYMELELRRSHQAFVAAVTKAPLWAYGFEQTAYTGYPDPITAPWGQASYGDNPINPFSRSSDPQNPANPVLRIARPPNAVYRPDRAPLAYTTFTQPTGAPVVGNYLITLRVFLDSPHVDPPDLILELAGRTAGGALISGDTVTRKINVYGVRGQWVTVGALLEVPWPQCGQIGIQLWADYLSKPGSSAVYYVDDCRVYQTDTALRVAAPVVAGASSSVSVTGLAQNWPTVKLYVNGVRRSNAPAIVGGVATFSGVWLAAGDIVSAIQESDPPAFTRLASDAVIATP